MMLHVVNTLRMFAVRRLQKIQAQVRDDLIQPGGYFYLRSVPFQILPESDKSFRVISSASATLATIRYATA